MRAGGVILFRMATVPVRRLKVERPRSVTILVVFQLFQSLTLLTYGGYRIATTEFPSRAWEFSLDFLADALVQVINSGAGMLVLGVLTLVIALQLYGMKSYAWLMAMSLQGIILLTSLIAYLRQEPNFILMLLGVVLIFYLNQYEIQTVMRGRQDEI
jgi:hypothetical protein